LRFIERRHHEAGTIDPSTRFSALDYNTILGLIERRHERRGTIVPAEP